MAGCDNFFAHYEIVIRCVHYDIYHSVELFSP